MSFDFLYSQDYVFTRFLLQRGLALLYFIGFLIAANQGRGLLGRNGILPIPLFLKRTTFKNHPSIFYFKYSDELYTSLAWIGAALSALTFFGFSDSFGPATSLVIWILLWLLYMSFVNVGQVFYGFGWEILLLEAGFLAIFLGPTEQAVPVPIIWLYRWLLFRVMFGAGLIKIRGDECWRDLTCMYYHYETQPLPNPLSWFFHRLPKWFHKLSLLYNHLVELVMPFFYFFPSYLGYISGLSTILFQSLIALSGNLSWLNLISIVLCISCFDDNFFKFFRELPPIVAEGPVFWQPPAMLLVTAVLLFLSKKPLMNMISKQQVMNRSFDPWHLVNTYGAFGSITRERMEIVLEGTLVENPDQHTKWVEYEFKGKPGNPQRCPPQVSPYHFKIDWQMWFAAMSDYRFHPWILNLVGRILSGNKNVISLLKEDPFEGQPPKYIQAKLYRYSFTKKLKDGWWERTYLGLYLPPLSLDDESFRIYLLEEGLLPEEE